MIVIIIILYGIFQKCFQYLSLLKKTDHNVHIPTYTQNKLLKCMLNYDYLIVKFSKKRGESFCNSQMCEKIIATEDNF